MPRKARVHYVSLHSSLVNLPISIYGPLLERSIRPQNLAVHLAVISQTADKNGSIEAYVGWTGMASASSLAQFRSLDSTEKALETIEMDPQYAQSIGIKEDDVVEVGLLYDLPAAKMVITEPVSPDDWEIIEIHASHVESTLLSQVRVAKTGQEINTWILGRTRVRLRVVDIDPKSAGNALLLTTNTEVSIAPKTRKTRAVATSVADKGVKPDQKREKEEPQPSSEERNAQVLRSIPLRILHDTGSANPSADPLAYVSPPTFSALFSSLKLVDDTSHLRASVKLIPSPSDPLTSSTAEPKSPSRIGIARKERDTGLADGESDKDIKVYIGSMPGLPGGQIVFVDSIEGLQDWDIVKVAASSENTSVSADRHVQCPASQKSITVSTSSLAGVNDILIRAVNFCIRSYVMHSQMRVVHGVSGLLVTGRSGAGKTSIVDTVAKYLRDSMKTLAFTFYVDVSRHSEQSVPTIKSLLQYWYNKASWHRPSVLVLDNLDKLLGRESEHTESFRTRHLTELFLSIYSPAARTMARNSWGIVLIATATSTSALHPLVNSSHIFQEIIEIKPPNKDARKDILSTIVKNRLRTALSVDVDPDAPPNYSSLSTQTEGYLATDLHDLVARAFHQVAMRAAGSADRATLKSDDFTAAMVDFVPLSLRDIQLQKSGVNWSDIGGLHETRRVLRETLEWPTKYSAIFAQSPLRLRSGLLLYGYPGCGKTMLASAVAKECGLNFISVKGPEILNKYIGASEQSVRDLFERASAAKPCVLFFDEFDSIAPKRGHDSTGVTDRVVNQLLTQMDGAEGLDGVYVLAATSRPDLVDSALLRPGRLDKSLFCGMPDFEERRDILRAVCKKVPLSPSVNLDDIAEATGGFSGADLQALVYNAHLEVVHSSITTPSVTREAEQVYEYVTIGGSAKTTVRSRAEESALQARLRQIDSAPRLTSQAPQEPAVPPKIHEITGEHFHAVLKTTKPSVSVEERQRLGRIYREFISDRGGDLPVPADAGGVGTRVSLM